MVAPAEQTREAVVEAVGLTKIFRDFWGRPKARAVNGIDFAIYPGQVFGLLGPNGSGKSTTVKMILGLLYPTRGQLKVFGVSPTNVDMKHRIGYLPEESYLYRYLTAGETLDFFGALFGLSAEERKRRSAQLLEMVGLANSFHRPVGEFSKGMARRIGLAQALVNDPDLVVLDEPTSGLDPIGCREVKDVIRLLADRGKTVVLCSHLLADVEDVCDEVLVLYGGKVRTEGQLRDILTVEDKTRIQTPRLDDEALACVRDTIANFVDREAITVDHPTMNLEDFFLDVVRQARDASLETAGAQSGGEIAPYLRGTGSASPNAVLAALQAERAPAAAAGDAAEPLEAVAPEPRPEASAPTVDEAKLRRLAAAGGGADSEESEAETRGEPPPSTPTTEEASEKLRNLLGGEKEPPKKTDR